MNPALFRKQATAAYLKSETRGTIVQVASLGRWELMSRAAAQIEDRWGMRRNQRSPRAIVRTALSHPQAT